MKHNFGTMEKGATKSYSFTFTNEGTEPLTLAKGETSCKCTISALKTGQLEPGESTEVKLAWTPKVYETGFSQTAEIHTNDPVNRIVMLTIEGKVIQSVRPVPESVTLGSVPLHEGATTELRLLNYAEQPLEITRIAWGDEALAPYFSAQIEPMTAEDVARDPDAKSGKLVKIAIKSGLPLGPINQKIRLTTNMPELPVLEVPLIMTVTGDISLIGPGYVSDTSTLMLGRIRSAEGHTTKLNLLVKGPHAETTNFTVGKINPDDVLQVTLGQRKSLKEGALFLIPLEIAIAPGSRSANHISPQAAQQGLIVLETNHADVKQLPIHVRFAVE
jgi:DNA-directed RNA polymerase subunit H (RpoH/RPB5)